jgi:hypothetical protein
LKLSISSVLMVALMINVISFSIIFILMVKSLTKDQ